MPRQGCRSRSFAGKRGFSDATFHKWRAKYGGMLVTNAKRLRALASEKAYLKRLLAQAHCDILALRDVLGVKTSPSRSGAQR